MGNIKTTLSRAVIRMLDPIVHILLRFEVSHSEFTELAKRSYVNVAFRHFSILNRKKTNSRVSVITGLSRKEVVRIVDTDIDEEPVTKGPLNRAKRVIGGWLADPDFQDENSQPKILPLRGEALSFEELVSRYSGGITARAILDELIRVAAVEKINKSNVKLTHHGYVPQDSDNDVIDVLTRHVSDHLNTAVHNLIEKETPRFQREVTYVDMPQSIVDEFQKLSQEKSSALLVELNQWLADKKRNIDLNSDEAKSRIGIGIYYIQDNDKDLMD
ncbi:MAG: DUF6502 family protein [Thiohalomonadales bacterium]